ncbi:phosphoribosylaminoimidazolesuccinocarboxamide synthase [secondary endosymbiont of Ctenarytaina eucalypti]|uniref:Phosphoribosylaminoimidazole-succinocarboxamide synthase n=1 Tax=secondary endosymbiont of Ctenarytaina eucalypti TaxID=1199245 RepID=J3TFL1_9ENTR|nr:phosphoribosylaminoimidazolesuccinocarboxamide synthase [secondary endosymbiont of Ctenarytaina eucalypti]AFP85042.1 phosphoribosylaminoimidazole-succinocarboxamide synthase [secondary endosymbiont of Ctenarytaina eucalypti]
MKKLAEVYRGKAKTVYATEDPNFLILTFRNDTSSLDGRRVQKFERKGMINNKFNYFIMNKLADVGIPTQIVRLLSDHDVLVKKLAMIPVECVLRNIAAGCMVRRLGIEEGLVLNPPIFDLFLKNDVMHDPIINESYCITFGWASAHHLSRMKQLTYKVNDILSTIFDNAGFILVDFKLEFGLCNGEIVLGDEFSPDVSRVWDKKTLDNMDKDRFRKNLGDVIKAYESLAKRIGVKLD